MEVVEEVEDSEAEIVAGLEVGIEEMIVGMIEEEEGVELASIVTERVIWQEIAMKVIEGIADEVEGVVLEAEVEETEHVTIAIKRVTWLENARKKIAEIVEDECDRQLLCEKIVQRIESSVNAYATQVSEMLAHGGDSALQPSPSPKLEAEEKKEKKRAGAKSSELAEQPSSTARDGGHGLKLNGASINLENINIATYVCDFGNVIITKSAKKSFRLTNVGKIPITFNFDKKILNQAGITIEPDKAVKVAPNASVLYNVVYTTRKTSKFGRQRF